MSDGGNDKLRIDLARVLRATLQHMDALLRLDPWLPVPQSGCTFLFGERKAPLPIGALHRILERLPHVDGVCPSCQGFLMPFVFGGLERNGGFKGCCLDCGRVFYLPLGSAEAVARFVAPALAGTPYAIAQVLENEARFGPREPLWRALQKLGVGELPDEDWSRGCDCLEPWPAPASRPEPGTGEEQAKGAPPTAPARKRPDAARKLRAFWRTVKQQKPARDSRLFRPVDSPVTLRTLTGYAPLLLWGTHDPLAPRIAVAALVPVPGDDRLALWVSKLSPFAQDDKVHGLLPTDVVDDPEALATVLGEAFRRGLPIHGPVMDGLPTFVCPFDEYDLTDEAWAAIVRRLHQFDDGLPLEEALDDIERLNGDPSQLWSARRARRAARRHRWQWSDTPLDEAKYERWWKRVSARQYAENVIGIMLNSWREGPKFAHGAAPGIVGHEEAEGFLHRLLHDDDARREEHDRARRWRLHRFAPSWYRERGVPHKPLPVRSLRLVEGVTPEQLPIVTLREDLVDFLNESKSSRDGYAAVVKRLIELADAEGGCQGPAGLGMLECENCGFSRAVTPGFLRSAATSYSELPRFAAKIHCSRCNAVGARWSGPLN